MSRLEWTVVLPVWQLLQDAAAGRMSNAYREAVHVLECVADWLKCTYSACAVLRVRIHVIMHILVKVVHARLG